MYLLLLFNLIIKLIEKEFKTIAYIIKNTNGQVVELNEGCYLYLSNEVINDIVRNNKDIYDSIFNEGVKTSESIVEATKKDAEGMSERIKKLESQLNTSNEFIDCYKNDIEKLKDIINSKEAAIAQYVRDINYLNERIRDIKDIINKYIEMTDKIDNNFKNDIIKVINKEFESKFANNVEPFNWDEHDDSKCL